MKRYKCIVCGKDKLSRNEIGINKKILGRQINSFYCIDCLADYLEVTVEKLHDMIDDFKSSGCTLF